MRTPTLMIRWKTIFLRVGLMSAALATYACGKETSAGERPPAPDVTPSASSSPSAGEPAGLPASYRGDCHKTPGTSPTKLFSPGDIATSDVPAGTLVVAGGYVYAALLSSVDKSSAGPVAIYGGNTSTGAWAPFTVIGSTWSFSEGPVVGRDHLYWWQRPLSGGDLASDSYPSALGYRRSDDSQATVAGVVLNVDATTFAVDGDQSFVFTCSNLSGGLPACSSASDVWTLTATELSTAQSLWTSQVPGDHVDMHSSIVTDASAIYWHSPHSINVPGAEHVFQMPRAGGAESEVAVDLQSGESIWSMARDTQGLLVVALGPRDSALTNEVVLYRVPLPASSGSPTRVSLGHTYEEGLFVAFDDASVYITLDALAPTGNLQDETRILVRACKDGTNSVQVLAGKRWGAYSMQDLALDDARVYFTANNGVYTVDK